MKKYIMRRNGMKSYISGKRLLAALFVGLALTWVSFFYENPDISCNNPIQCEQFKSTQSDSGWPFPSQRTFGADEVKPTQQLPAGLVADIVFWTAISYVSLIGIQKLKKNK